jgi:ubiquinone/menaquinone biosynthesis C-methylase UbiE
MPFMHPSLPVPEMPLRTWVGPFEDKQNYLDTGRMEAARLIELCSLDPQQHIVDLGCGCGRMAIHILPRLGAQGSYLGVDNSPELIEWCVENISPLYRNVRFQHIDVHGSYSNPNGTLSASQVHIDLETSKADLLMAISLFTHMLIPDVRFYLAEARRVLKLGGRLAATFFLLNDASVRAMRTKAATYDFQFDAGCGSKGWRQEPLEEAVAHEEGRIVQMIADAHFKVHSLLRGGWIANTLENHQDMILATASE